MKKIEVKGPIIRNSEKWIYEWFGMEATCPKDIGNAIAEANGEPITVEINSGGGDVFAGSEIYTALRAYSGDVEIHIVGLAASAASGLRRRDIPKSAQRHYLWCIMFPVRPTEIATP